MMSKNLFLLLLVTSIQTFIINELTQNLHKLTPKHVEAIAKKDFKAPPSFKKQHVIDIQTAKSKAEVIKAARKKKKNLGKEVRAAKGSDKKDWFRPNSLLNFLKKARRKMDLSMTDSSSSSLELKNWKEEWQEHWLQKKFEAINASRPRGDIINMAAARLPWLLSAEVAAGIHWVYEVTNVVLRGSNAFVTDLGQDNSPGLGPWGVPCGDPNQHDMPWGTCMLPMECEAEYRIFRGDYFCGRTQFICCALQLTTYDMYQGFDVSFEASSLETDTEEKKNRDRGSKERKRRKRVTDKRRRRRERIKRKRKIKRNIKRIIREIRKILNRSYRNGTTERKKKTRQLKKFVKILKKKYKEERKVVMDLHEFQLIKADIAVQDRLNQIKGMNQNFIKNSTYRDIIVNGTVNEARLLLKAYPELAKALQTRRGGVKQPRDYLDYDIEYGYLYY